MKSYNKLILETYKPEALKSEVRHGIAMVGQKNKVVGLKLLVDAQIVAFGTFAVDGLSSPCILKKGAMVYIREEILHSQPWAKASLNSPRIKDNFMIVDASFVEFVDQDAEAGQLRE